MMKEFYTSDIDKVRGTLQLATIAKINYRSAEKGVYKSSTVGFPVSYDVKLISRPEVLEGVMQLGSGNGESREIFALGTIVLIGY